MKFRAYPCEGQAFHQGGRGGSSEVSCFYLQKLQLSAGHVGHPWTVCNFSLLLNGSISDAQIHFVSPDGVQFFSLVKSLAKRYADNKKLHFLWVDPDPFPTVSLSLVLFLCSSVSLLDWGSLNTQFHSFAFFYLLLLLLLFCVFRVLPTLFFATPVWFNFSGLF